MYLLQKSEMFVIMFFVIIAADTISYRYNLSMDQATTLLQFKVSRHSNLISDNLSRDNHYNNLVSRFYKDMEKRDEKDDHFLKDGLNGQPDSAANLKQFAGEISVDGRALFYYFVESSSNSLAKPLILWLNGGPGCSSLGMGALTEIGPFGVNPDGKTLYEREFAWNKVTKDAYDAVANVLFLESPAGVGFSYSNTTSDYDLSGDRRTAEDTYIFLMKWFERYPIYKGRDFYLIGESYAGYYIPQLSDIILDRNDKNTRDSTPTINLSGIMIGNGLIDDASDTKGLIDYAWSHALVSDETRKEFQQKCGDNPNESPACFEVMERIIRGIGNLDFMNIYRPLCQPAIKNSTSTARSDPCEILYVQSYLNLPHVQVALNANKTKLPYPWEPCSRVIRWKDSASSMYPIYERLMAHGSHILLYSGDVDLCVPVTGSRYALAGMNLKVLEPWHWWSISDTLEVAGYKVVYDGLTYATVRGAGHEVSKSQPDRLYALLNSFVGNL